MRINIPNTYKIIIKVVVTVALVVYVFHTVNVNDVKKLFIRSNLGYLTLAAISYFFSQVFASWRLLDFLRDVGIKVSFGFNFRLYLLGLFYNIFLPGGIGGDGYKVYLLKRKFKRSAKEIFMALLFDRLSGLWALCCLCLFLVILIPRINIPVIWPCLLMIVGSVVYVLVVRKFFDQFSGKWMIKHFKAAMVQSLMLFSIICILLSQGFDGEFSPYLLSFILSAVIGLINIGVGGLGVRDVAMAHAADLFQINQELSVFITFTFWFISVGISLLGIWPVYKSAEFEPMPSQMSTPEDSEKTESEA